MSSLPSTMSLRNQQQNSSEQIRVEVEPVHNLEFVCTKFQTTASLQVTLIAQETIGTFTYQIKATNKEDYKVSQPQGQLTPYTAKVIYFYLRQSAPVNTNLKDKFLLVIREGPREVYSRKFAIIIESALQKKCSAMTAVPQLSSEANNVTKFLSSVYTTPSSADISRVQHKSEFRDTFLPPNQHSHIHSSGHNDLLGSKADGQGGVVEKSFKHGGSLRGSRSQQGQKMANSQINFNSIANYDPEKLQSMRSEEDILKQELSNSMREIEKMKRKVMLTGRANKSSHSRARFRIYLTVLAVLLAFLLGIWVKSLNIGGELKEAANLAREKIWGSGPEEPYHTVASKQNM